MWGSEPQVTDPPDQNPAYRPAHPQLHVPPSQRKSLQNGTIGGGVQSALMECRPSSWSM